MDNIGVVDIETTFPRQPPETKTLLNIKEEVDILLKDFDERNYGSMVVESNFRFCIMML